MSSLGELGRLTDAEYADLNDRVDRFHAAWKADGTPGPEAFLPAPGARHRHSVLVELIKVDMERRAQGGLSVRIETYLGRFPADLPEATVPVSLLAEEYRLRHRHADKPSLEEYRHRFRAQYEALARYLAGGPAVAHPPTASFPHGAAGAEGDPSGHTPSDDARPTRSADPPPDPKPPAKGGGRPTVRNDPPSFLAPPSSGAPPAPRRTDRLSGSGSTPPLDVLPADANYRLIRRIARGEFGEVYEAASPGGVRVAVKRIFRALDHPASQSEAEALESLKLLRHSYLTRIHAFWTFEDRLVIVMDLADGTLADRMEYHQKRGLDGVPPEELVPFTEEAGEALNYLHSQNISHRDVKPKNLLHLRGHAMVADFGLAREHAGDVTTVAFEVGTLAYMAPELQSGKVSLYHTDQYSLAATYVHARLGHPPYQGRLANQLREQHLTGTPDLAGLPEAEQAVLRKALAKNPKDRYASCVAFAKALRKATLAPPEPPRPPDPPGLLAKAVQTVALALVLAIVVLLALKYFGPSVPQTTAKHEATTKPEVSNKPEEPKKLWLPPGWAADDPAKTTTVPSTGKTYYDRLTRTVAGEKLVAILVSPTRGATTPAPFYMLENKVSNREFQALWEEAAADPTSLITTLYRGEPAKRELLLPGRWWRRGLVRGDFLPVDPREILARAKRPVVAVTAPEAVLIAEKLGGLLPTFSQWRKATGAMIGDETRPDRIGLGPAGPAIQGMDDDEKRAHLCALRASGRVLAAGLTDGPWDVDKETYDVSYCGIHQLVSNGPEWLREGDRSQPILPENLVSFRTDTPVTYVGHPIKIPEILTFDDINGDGFNHGGTRSGKCLPATEWQANNGFRVVLEPPP